MLFQKRIPFEEVASQVVRLKAVKSARTRANATWQISRLIRNFGEERIDQISEELWTDYVARETAHSPRGFYDDRKYMGMILRYAKRKGLVGNIIHLEIPDLPSSVGRALAPDEIATLERNAGPTLRFQIRIAWKMGLRRGEMLGLELDRIDLDHGYVLLRPQDTKCRVSRLVPIPIDLLAEFRTNFELAARYPGRKFLFASPGGISGQRDNKTAWRRCKSKSNVTARWHDLRHTAATTMLRRGVPKHLVKAYLGMNDRTLARYSHFEAEDIAAVAEAMIDRGGRYEPARESEVVRQLFEKYPAGVLQAAAEMSVRLAG